MRNIFATFFPVISVTRSLIIGSLTAGSMVVGSLSFDSQAFAHDEGAHATYLGNEGFLVADGGTKILFDAFYAQSYGQYTLVPENISSALRKNESPYDDVDAIFVSHVHGDHFSPAPAIEYMRTNETVVLYGSPQVYDAFLEGGLNENHPIMKRVITVDVRPDDPAVELLSLIHISEPTRPY